MCPGPAAPIIMGAGGAGPTAGAAGFMKGGIAAKAGPAAANMGPGLKGAMPKPKISTFSPPKGFSMQRPLPRSVLKKLPPPKKKREEPEQQKEISQKIPRRQFIEP
jgi:hypothetical protein